MLICYDYSVCTLTVILMAHQPIIPLQDIKSALNLDKVFTTLIVFLLILYRMVTDVQLAIFANMLGVSLFLLVVLYHYVAVNNPKKQE